MSATPAARSVFEDAVDDAGPVKAGDDGHSSGHGGGLEPADVLHPPQVQLQVVTLRVQRRDLPLLAPGDEDPRVRLGVPVSEASRTTIPTRCADSASRATGQWSDNTRQ